jgi:Ca2+-binding RTX toxin-like protein
MHRRITGLAVALVAFFAVAGVAQADLIEGTNGNDTIQGTAHDDVIVAKGGNDYVIGGGGADFVRGGRGSDTIKVYKAIAWPDGSFHDDYADAVRCGQKVDYVLAGLYDKVAPNCDHVQRRK